MDVGAGADGVAGFLLTSSLLSASVFFESILIWNLVLELLTLILNIYLYFLILNIPIMNISIYIIWPWHVFQQLQLWQPDRKNIATDLDLELISENEIYTESFFYYY